MMSIRIDIGNLETNRNSPKSGRREDRPPGSHTKLTGAAGVDACNRVRSGYIA